MALDKKKSSKKNDSIKKSFFTPLPAHKPSYSPPDFHESPTTAIKLPPEYRQTEVVNQEDTSNIKFYDGRTTVIPVQHDNNPNSPRHSVHDENTVRENIVYKNNIKNKIFNGSQHSYTEIIDTSELEESYQEYEDTSYYEDELGYEEEDYFEDDYENFKKHKTGFWNKVREKNIKSSEKDKEEDFQEENYQYTKKTSDIFDELEELENDYKDSSQASSFKTLINQMFNTSIATFIITLAIFIVSMYVTLSNYISDIPVIGILDVTSNPESYILFNIITLIFAICINYRTISSGLSGFFTLKANSESMLALSSIFSILFCVFLLIKPVALTSSKSVHVYNSVIIGSLLFNCLGKIFKFSRLKQNFKIISNNKPKIALEIAHDDDLENDITRIMGEKDLNVTIPVKAKFLKRFMELSLNNESYNTIERTLVPICFIAAITISIGTYFLLENVYIALSVLISTLCICSPFTSLLSINLPLLSASSKLSKFGAVLTGPESIYEFSETDAIIINASDIFPKGTVNLQGLKTFEGGRIDDSIIEASSVASYMNSPLSNMFLNILENKSDLLCDVDTIVYEDEMGVSAWVRGKRVLIGNRDLMINHNIDVPSLSYEKKYKTGDREIVYLANSGVLTSMFTVKYSGNIQIASMLRKIASSGINIIVRTSDPNITNIKISDIFSVPIENIRVIPERNNGSFERVTSSRNRVDAKAFYCGNILGYLSAILTANKIGISTSFATSLQTIGIVFAYAIITFCAFFSQMSFITPITLIINNLFWLLCIIIILNIKK